MEKNSRPMDHITNTEQKNHVILKYLINQEILVKMSDLDQSGMILKAAPGSDEIVLQLPEVWDFSLKEPIFLSKVLARYIEIQCAFISQVDDHQVKLKVEKVAIAKKDRQAPRYPVTEEGFVNITNIISSKTIIEANMFNIPTLVRVNFEEYEKKLNQNPNDFVSISVFKSDSERAFEVVKRTQKILLLEDCSDLKSYNNPDPNYIDYEEEIDDHLEAAIQKYRDKKTASELIFPIIYTNELEEQIPIGYVWVQSKENKITKDYVSRVQTLMVEMVERIKDANLARSEARFPVLDISTTGLKIKINDSNLMMTLPKQKGFLFDLFFKMQAPFHVFVRVAWWRKDDEGNLILGVEFSNKSRTYSEKQRFEQNIEVVKQIGSAA
ncbi:DUF1577 domain-containing protein [Leptospira ilyithenensis]|uniref:DUF1577 domain-containing protein n=1 Tax=Leptospira ilyithenensis TaxID=2484901 RepID=A0A4R9LR72_9LEPT|nr:DUF1577 domain-containing protein [Leptospira ilyithenensis]TGN09394.1 DUF1577 domain-containing protein [Leptospira ilyithenensis]